MYIPDLVHVFCFWISTRMICTQQLTRCIIHWRLRIWVNPFLMSVKAAFQVVLDALEDKESTQRRKICSESPVMGNSQWSTGRTAPRAALLSKLSLLGAFQSLEEHPQAAALLRNMIPGWVMSEAGFGHLVRHCVHIKQGLKRTNTSSCGEEVVNIRCMGAFSELSQGLSL